MVEDGVGEMSKRQTLLRATKIKKLWRAVTTQVLKGHGT